MNFRDSNEYETRFSEPDEQHLFQAPPDDRDKWDPDFEVREELAYNLDVEQPAF